MAKHGQFTYMARIKSDVICGGALITWRHVLTAAHCIVTTPSTTRTVIKPKARFRIHLGDHSKKKKIITKKLGEFVSLYLIQQLGKMVNG